MRYRFNEDIHQQPIVFNRTQIIDQPERILMDFALTQIRKRTGSLLVQKSLTFL